MGNIVNTVKGFNIKEFLISFGISGVIGFIACRFIGWWAIAPVCGIIAAWRNESIPTSMSSGFAAGLGLFTGYAMFLNTTNGGVLGNQIAEMLGGKLDLKVFSMALTGTQMIQLTGLIGGIVGAMGAWSGALFRRMF
jgi:hypothetical protein